MKRLKIINYIKTFYVCKSKLIQEKITFTYIYFIFDFLENYLTQ